MMIMGLRETPEMDSPRCQHNTGVFGVRAVQSAQRHKQSGTLSNYMLYNVRVIKKPRPYP